MFYHISMDRLVVLHPRHFGSELYKRLKQQLYLEVEGTCTGRYGFVVAITDIEEIGAGILLPSDGYVQYPIKFKGIVFRPFKGEVLDGLVTQINKVGVFVNVGPLSCFISRLSMPVEYQYFLIDSQPFYKTKNEENVIAIDDKIRFKLIGTRVEAHCIFGVGTLINDYLGVITNT